MPFHESQSPTAFSSKCCLIASPLMYLGQYFLFLFMWRHRLPAFSTQQPPSIHKTHCPGSQHYLLQRWAPTHEATIQQFFLIVELGMISDGEFLPSMSSICQRIPDNDQHTVSYSFPNGHGFHGTNIHPGQLYLFIHVLMDSSKQLTQLGVNCSVLLASQASMISRTCQK